jgi:hypothetical protein
MAVWDLNSNLDVCGMQTFYVKTMSAYGGHFGPRSGSLNTILEVDHLKTIFENYIQ